MGRIQAKYWNLSFALCIVCIIGVQFIFWMSRLAVLNMPLPHCGDIARIAMTDEYSQCRSEARTLSRQASVAVLKSENKYKFLTLGDSVNRGRGAGVNNYWQDHLASALNVEVGWLSELSESLAIDVVQYHKSGLLEELGAKYLVLQVAESNMLRSFGDSELEAKSIEVLADRQAIMEKHKQVASAFDINQGPHPSAERAWRQAYDGDTNSGIVVGVIQLLYSIFGEGLVSFDRWVAVNSSDAIARPFDSVFMSGIDFLTDLDEQPVDGKRIFMAGGLRNPIEKVFNDNLRFLQTKIGRHRIFGSDSYFTAVQFAQLKRPLFSNAKPDILPYYLRDWKVNRDLRDESRLLIVHKNLNYLANLVSQSGVQLVFMPTPNKLTAYQSELVNPIETESTVFERLRVLPDKRYIYIDAYGVVVESVRKGMVDVYFADDSHWSNTVLPDVAQLFKDLP
jgi:hypothetical protein